MKLYEISEQYRNLQSLFDEGLIDAQSLADTIESINAEFTDKARNCVMMMREYEMRLSAIKAEKDRLSNLEKAQKSAIDSIENYLRENLEATNKDKVDLGIFSLTLKKPSLKLPDVIDESKITKEFYKIIPEHKQLDRVALLNAVKLKQVDIELAEGKRALIIK